MASIQQSMNQAIGAASAMATIYTHLHKASPSYQLQQIDKRKAVEAESQARDYDKKAQTLSVERENILAKMDEPMFETAKGVKRRGDITKKEYQALVDKLEDVSARQAMYAKEAHNLSPSAARQDVINTLPPEHEAIGKLREYRQKQEETKNAKIQAQKQAEQKAKASLEFRAKALGVTAEQLAVREAFLKQKKEATK